MNDLGEFVPGLPVPGSSLPIRLAAVATVHDGLLVEHELTLSAGATAADLTTAMISVPPSAALVGQHDGEGLSLVFREVPVDGRHTESVEFANPRG